MNYKRLVWSIFIFAFLIEGIFLLLAYSVDCWPTPSGLAGLICGGFAESYLEPVFISVAPILVTSLILFFVRPEVFTAWRKFAVPAFIIMFAIIFYTYNNEPATGGWVNWGSDDQFATVLLPPLFFLMSLFIIVSRSYRLRRVS